MIMSLCLRPSVQRALGQLNICQFATLNPPTMALMREPKPIETDVSRETQDFLFEPLACDSLNGVY